MFQSQGGRSPKGLVHDMLLQFTTLGGSKIEVSDESKIFDIVTSKNDHPIYVEHVLGRIYVFCNLSGY